MQQYSPGDQIGGEYTVLKVFGGEKQSGMGVVYLVRAEEDKTSYVLKTFQHAVSDNAKRQFISEAHAWIRAGAHPNIVQAYWVREIVNQLFVAAEYVMPDEESRNTLTHFINEGQLRPEIILHWAAQFCYGMDYARTKGVLAHRDIKPDNLMIDQTGNLKITDFGLAKSVESDATVAKKQGWWLLKRTAAVETVSKTKTGSAMGTLPYMAPEQFLNAKAVDHRADIYSFGIILYQMVTGNAYPYRIKSDSQDIGAEFFQAHSAQAPLAVDSALMPIISRCLEKRPERRYATYDAFLADIVIVAKQLHIRLPRVVHVAKVDEEIYAQAQSYVALGDKDRALKAINDYVSKYAEYECGWTEKGRIHFERGEYLEGLAATRKSLEVNPYNTHAWNNFGILLNRTAAPISEIKKAYANALHFDPYNTAAMMNLVGPLVLQREYSEAALLAVKALKLRPEKPLVRQKSETLLKEFLDNKHVTAAEILLYGWTEARSADTDAWHNLGLISFDKGDLDHATSCFKRVYEIAPQDNFAVLQLARLCFQRKKARECLDYCNQLIERGYELLVAVGLKVCVLNFAGGYEQALSFLQPYLDHNPENDALWVVLAEIHEYRDNYDLAIQALQRAKILLQHSRSEHSSENLRFVGQKLDHLLTVR